MTNAAFKSAHARYAKRVAREQGYVFESLDGDDGYAFEIRDGARRAVFAAGAGTPFVFNDARAAALARDKAFAANILARAGVAVPPHRLFFVTEQHKSLRAPGREPRDAIAYANEASYPLFCKPVSGSCGEFAERVDDAVAFKDYLRRVASAHYAILVQPLLSGREYRVLWLKGETLAAYEKLPAQATGDGKSSLYELAAAARRADWLNTGRAGARDASGRVFAAEDVPSNDAQLFLDGPRNRAMGGQAGPLFAPAPAQLAHIAQRSTQALALRFAGIDVFDVSRAGDLSDLIVLEVNSNPMFETLESQGRWDLIARIWRENIVEALK